MPWKLTIAIGNENGTTKIGLNPVRTETENQHPVRYKKTHAFRIEKCRSALKCHRHRIGYSKRVWFWIFLMVLVWAWFFSPFLALSTKEIDLMKMPWILYRRRLFARQWNVVYGGTAQYTHTLTHKVPLAAMPKVVLEVRNNVARNLHDSEDIEAWRCEAPEIWGVNRKLFEFVGGLHSPAQYN